MNQSDSTPIGEMNAFDLTSRLTTAMQEAYFRRSRQLPANIADMASVLKGDLLRFYKSAPIGKVADAIVTHTLHNPDTPLSVTFFFNAVKTAFPVRTNAQQAAEPASRPSTEADLLANLDNMADILAEEDARTTPAGPLHIIRPAFNPIDKFAQLVARGQMDTHAYESFITDGIRMANADRLASRKPRLSEEYAKTDPDAVANAKRLAVIAWLRACNRKGIKPSQAISQHITINL